MLASLNSKPYTTIVSRYSLTNACDKTSIITFYDKISSLIQHTEN